jgi:DNA-binding PadR family transcriptional regulator
MHGYEIRKQLAGLLGTFRAFSYGSLYPSLRRMQEAGWIEEDGTAPDSPGAAGFGARSRRGKRVYRITAEGKEQLAALLSQVGPEAYDAEGFGTRLAFFAQTRSEIRMQILEGRRQRISEQAESIRRSLARTRERLDRYTLQLQEHGLESADREVRWLTELIEGERRKPPTAEHRTPDPPT